MRFRIAVAAVSLTLSMLAVAQAKKSAGGSSEAAIMAADHAYLEAFNSHDPGKCAAMFAPGGQMLAAGMPAASTPDQIKKVFATFYGMKDLKFSWKPTSAMASGNLGFSSGTYELSFTDNGKPVKDKGKYVTVWQKQGDGTWKVIRDIENSDGPGQ